MEFCFARIIYKGAQDEHNRLVAELIRAVKNDAELALMRGRASHLGEKAMLLSAIYSAVNHPDPAKRIAMYDSIIAAIDKYLGIKKFEKRGRRKKRKRKKLLPRN